MKLIFNLALKSIGVAIIIYVLIWVIKTQLPFIQIEGIESFVIN